MTLLKAYLMGTKDPIILAKVFYEDLILKDVSAVKEAINEELGWDWEGSYNSWEEEIKDIEEELDELNSKITDYRKQVSKISEGFPDAPPHLQQYIITVYNKKIKLLQSDAQECRIEIQEAKRNIESLEQERDKVTREMTKVSDTYEGLKDLPLKEKITIHTLGLNLLIEEKTRLEQLTSKGKLKTIMGAPDPRKLKQIREKYAKLDVNTKPKEGFKRVENFKEMQNELEEAFDVSTDTWRKLHYQDKFRSINSKIAISEKALLELGVSKNSLNAKREAKKLGYIPYPESELPGTVAPDINIWDWYKDKKGKTYFYDKEKNKFIESELPITSSKIFHQKEHPDAKKTKEGETEKVTFLSERLHERLADSSMKKDTDRNAFRKRLKAFFDSLPDENKDIFRQPPTSGEDAYGFGAVEYTKGDKRRKIKENPQTRLKNLRKLQEIFGSLPSNLKNDSNVSYILKALSDEINAEKVRMEPKIRASGTKTAAKDILKRLKNYVQTAHSSIKNYTDGDYPDRFLTSIKNIRDINVNFRNLKRIAEGDSLRQFEGLKVEDELESIKGRLNKKTKQGQSVLTHIENVWETEQFGGYRPSEERQEEISTLIGEELDTLFDNVEDDFDQLMRRKDIVWPSDDERYPPKEKMEEEMGSLLEELKDNISQLEQSKNQKPSAEDIIRLGKDYKRLGIVVNKLLKQAKDSGWKIALTKSWLKFRKQMEGVFQGPILGSGFEPVTEIHEKLPHERLELLKERVNGLEDAIHVWRHGMPPSNTPGEFGELKGLKFHKKDDKPDDEKNNKEIKDYLDLVLPKFDKSLLDPKEIPTRESGGKQATQSRINQRRQNLINRLVGNKDIRNKDLNWIAQYRAPPSQRRGRYEDEPEKFRVRYTGSDDVSDTEQQRQVGAFSERSLKDVEESEKEQEQERTEVRETEEKERKEREE